jgi:glycerate kinase
MANSMPVLVAPDALGGSLRAAVVAAAIGRGLERAGVPPPQLCPVAGGGRGTIDVLLPALGGETAGARILDPHGCEILAGFALLEDGATALVEAASQAGSVDRAEGGSSFGVGQLVLAAIDAGAEVVLLACGDAQAGDGGAGAVEAIVEGDGLRGAALVALCDVRPFDGAGGGLAATLRAELGAQLISGPAFVLEQLGFDERMRAARAVVVGEARLDAGTLKGRVAGEIAVRARQAGVPCHAVTVRDALLRFDARILDLQAIVEATTIAEIEAAGEGLAGVL